MRVLLVGANETISGANSMYGRKSKEAMNGCRRDLEMVKKIFEIGRDGTGERGSGNGAGKRVRDKSNRRDGGQSREGARQARR